jgi:ectoine hydroxylase-related dioxygenase (phytanoyl-CoA dioxygenase family)
VEQVLSPDEVNALAAELNQVYEDYPADFRSGAVRDEDEEQDFRYEMFNRSPLAQKAIANPAILEIIEPLLGEDCHVIANTCWRNPPRKKNLHGGGSWHIDAGPHIPRDPSIPWDERIPYPVFAIGAHIYLQDCPEACGPTAAIPFSHTSGQFPPMEERENPDLTWQGHSPVKMTARAGDIALFVSDVWHRRMPSTEDDAGRFFLQAHYGRRDIAQRIRTTADVNHISAQALQRITSERERKLLGLHNNLFYDG